MDSTQRLQAWGAAHAQARRAERAARDGGHGNAQDLWREAKSLRAQADRLHREAYESLDGRRGRTRR
jgi:hypothetical protein